MKKLIILLLLAVLVLTSCSPGLESHTVMGMDTFITFTLEGDLPDGAQELLWKYEKMFSRTDPDAELYLCNSMEEHTPSEELYALITEGLDICEKTNGAFDIRLGALSELWDFTSDTPAVPDKSDIDGALEQISTVTVRDGRVKKNAAVKIDLGAIAKGYIAEKCTSYLKENGFDRGIISVGGNISAFGKDENDPWRIGIRNPREGKSTIGYIEVCDGYISVSGDYERYFINDGVRYHHILDPKTGYPAKSGLISVAVISQSGALSDALSTALFVMGYDASMELYGSGVYDFEAVFVLEDGTVRTTPDSGFIPN